MKKELILLVVILGILSSSCVQKSYTRSVVYTLDVSGIKDIKSVGIRGNDKPLNWESDYAMQLNKKDSVYSATVTYKTGYKFTEVKFTINGAFELQNNPNRRIVFKDSTTTYYKAIFNKL